MLHDYLSEVLGITGFYQNKKPRIVVIDHQSDGTKALLDKIVASLNLSSTQQRQLSVEWLNPDLDAGMPPAQFGELVLAPMGLSELKRSERPRFRLANPSSMLPHPNSSMSEINEIKKICWAEFKEWKASLG